MIWTCLLEAILLCSISLSMLYIIFIVLLEVFRSFISVSTFFSFSRELCSFHDSVNFVLSSISSFHWWQSGEIQGIISFFLKLLKLTLCWIIWSVLKIFPWRAENEEYSFMFLWLYEMFCIYTQLVLLGSVILFVWNTVTNNKKLLLMYFITLSSSN